jgi:hypothetical protein
VGAQGVPTRTASCGTAERQVDSTNTRSSRRRRSARRPARVARRPGPPRPGDLCCPPALDSSLLAGTSGTTVRRFCTLSSFSAVHRERLSAGVDFANSPVKRGSFTRKRPSRRRAAGAWRQVKSREIGPGRDAWRSARRCGTCLAHSLPRSLWFGESPSGRGIDGPGGCRPSGTRRTIGRER